MQETTIKQLLLTSGKAIIGSRMSETLFTHPKKMSVWRLLTSRVTGKAISRLKDVVEGNYSSQECRGRRLSTSRMSGTAIMLCGRDLPGRYLEATKRE
jgi:hypothetical protein